MRITSFLAGSLLSIVTVAVLLRAARRPPNGIKTTRTRRIVRRAVLALAVVVLLPVSYIAGVAVIECSRHAGWAPSISMSRLAELYVYPVAWYATEGEDLPGSHECWELLIWSQQTGEKLGERYRCGNSALVFGLYRSSI